MNLARWPTVTVITHPVVQEQLTIARDKTTGVQKFRRLVKQITRFMAFEVFRDYPTEPLEVETPMAAHRGVRLARGLTLVPILSGSMIFLHLMQIACGCGAGLFPS